MSASESIRRMSPVVVSMFVLLAACQSPASMQPHASPAAIAAQTVVIHPVRDGLYASGQPAAGDWNAISARGVRTVVNLRTPAEMTGRDEAAEVQAAGMRYVSIPVADAAAITPDAARRLEQVLHESNAPVLLHCASGNRAGALLAVAAAQQEGMPAVQAVELGRRAGMKSTETRVRKVLGLAADPSTKEPAAK